MVEEWENRDEKTTIVDAGLSLQKSSSSERFTELRFSKNTYFTDFFFYFLRLSPVSKLDHSHRVQKFHKQPSITEV